MTSSVSLLANSPDSFDSFVAMYCLACHNDETQAGHLNLSDLPRDPSKIDSEQLIQIFDVLNRREMPPSDEPKPEPAELESTLVMLSELLKKTAAFPGNGNLIDHETLFTEPEVRRAPTPSRLWRMSPDIFMHYANGISRHDFLVAKGSVMHGGSTGMHPAFPYMTPPHTMKDHASTHLFEESTTDLLFDVVWKITEMQVNPHKRCPRSFKQILLNRDPSAKDWDTMCQMQFNLALRRDPNPEEQDVFRELGASTLSETHDAILAIRTALASVLLLPQAVYRYEIGRGGPDPFGRVRLSDAELMNAIAFATTDLQPDDDLLQAMASGKLSSQEEVERQVKRLLSSDAASGRLLRFFQQYFEYEKAAEIFKDARNKNFIRADVRIDDANHFISHIVKEDRDVLRRLLTEERLFAVARGNDKLLFGKDGIRRHVLPDYGLETDWDWSPVELVKPTTGRRSGMLTHPVWLLRFSDNEKNQAIQRGRWVYTKLLGGVIPDTPIGVDAVLPDAPDKSLRERMEVTKQDYCWRCHQRMDPLGLPFERFDDFGRWRETEVGNDVVTLGHIDIGDEELDGPVNDPFEMLQRMANSTRVEQVFVRHVFRYFMGRNETHR
ncbi:MAG: DUF1588 domain-containing protein [Planctomycetota bacterium]